jgi:hypothetical protein
LYTQDNSTSYANFFGNQLTPSITLIYKEPVLEKKTFLALTQIANLVWNCPNITTDTFSYGTTLQQSNLVTEDFILLGTNWNAPFWFDQNSIGGIIEGDVLQGNDLVIEFQSSNPSVFAYLSDIAIRYIDSPLLAK